MNVVGPLVLIDRTKEGLVFRTEPDEWGDYYLFHVSKVEPVDGTRHPAAPRYTVIDLINSATDTSKPPKDVELPSSDYEQFAERYPTFDDLVAAFGEPDEE